MMFYTYLWLRECGGEFLAGTPYYAGKGKGDRAFVIQGHRQNPPKDRSFILVQEFPDEATAFAAEKFLISYYGRIDLGTGCLRNRTDGGEGQSGRIVSQETRSKMRLSHIGIGHKHSDESRLKMSKAKLGNKNCLGRKVSEETRRRLSVSHLGKRFPRGNQLCP